MTASLNVFDLPLTVQTPSGQARDVVVEVTAQTPAGDLADALARHVGGAEIGRCTVGTARGAALPRETPLGGCDLRAGDVVRLTTAADAGVGATRVTAGLPVAELQVVGGPASGAAFPLHPGELVVGRGDGAEILIEDPSMSRRHAILGVWPDGTVAVCDAGSRNGTAVEGRVLAAGEVRGLTPGEHVEAGRSLLTVRPAGDGAAGAPRLRERDGRRSFNRPPRVVQPFEPVNLELDPPPAEPGRVRLPLAASLVPLVLGVAMAVFMHSLMFLMFAAFSPIMAFTSWYTERRSGRQAHRQGSAAFATRVAQLEPELQALRASETEARRRGAPDAGEILRRAENCDPALWERRPDDRDFLELRLGTADQPALGRVTLRPGGDEAQRAHAAAVIAAHQTVPAVPVLVQLPADGPIGLSGDPGRVQGLARWLAAQAAALQSPRDIVLAGAFPEQDEDAWRWMCWLPHTSPEHSPLDGPALALGSAQARALLKRLVALLEARREEAGARAGRAARWTRPAVVVVLDEGVTLDRPLVAELLTEGPEYGINVVWLGCDPRDLPGECRVMVEVERDVARLRVTRVGSASVLEGVSADGLRPELAASLARALAPIRDSSAGSTQGEVPKRVDVMSLLGPDALEAPALVERWRRAGGGLEAPIGMGASEPLVIDLERDGPHALVAGTTGAGKSELLQTLIVALAARHDPRRLNFLLIDYKGGAAFKDFAGLPHVVGTVTDLDGHLARRALISLNAELRRREAVLREVGAKDLQDMQRRSPQEAPPSLVIVIDEFAALAREVPEFVEGVVDVAQRGRSLGVHLILATQRPGGVVSENIRANTNLKIALRVAGVVESEDVIGAPDAARIARSLPGRAFARTGHGELTQFQTAYAGGAVDALRREVRVRDLEFGDAGAYAPPPDLGEPDAVTVLEALVAVIVDAAEIAGAPAPRSPWLPPLEEVATLDALRGEFPGAADADARLLAGVLDDPQHQRRLPLTLDLEQTGSVLVYGTGGSGKTSLLRVLAAAHALSGPPEHARVYGLDFGGRGLGVLEALPHCGSIIPGEDEERVRRLLLLLRRAIDERSELLARHGCATLSEYRARGPNGEPPVPRILVLVDGYAGFMAAYERVDLGAITDALPRLVADGRAAGVHFAITGDRRSAIPNTLAALVPAKLLLRLADEDDYAALGLDVRAIRGAQLPPGRGFLPDGTELQCAILGAAVSGEGQAAAIHEIAARVPAGAPAPPVAVLPTRVARDGLPGADEPLTALLGLGDERLEPVAVDVRDTHFLVTGPYRSGRSTALATIALGLAAGPGAPALELLAPRRSTLTDLPIWSGVARGTDACVEAAQRLLGVVETRVPEQPGAPLVIVVDDGNELTDTAAGPLLELLLRRGRDVGVRVVGACEVSGVRGFSPWLRELAKDGHGLLLEPDIDLDGNILGVRLPRRTNAFFPPGRGFLVVNGTTELLQVAG